MRKLRQVMTNKYKIAYFGGEPLGVPVLDILKIHGLVPELIVASPDRPAGRNLVMTPPRVKVWAEENGVTVIQPENLKDKSELSALLDTKWDLFIVVAYNHILPEWLLEIPQFKSINLHPSLLPKLRGPSPIRSAILKDKKDEVGVSVIVLDKEMDHGPIVASEPLTIEDNDWPMNGILLDTKLTQLGANLLARIIPDWLEGKITPTEQDHSLATYTEKFTKGQGELVIEPNNLPQKDEAYEMYLKICAFAGIGGTYFFYNDKRIKITSAKLQNEKLVIEKIIPEGKGETDFDLWLQNT